MANKYFTLEQVKASTEALRKVDGKWLLIPLVLAANGVRSKGPEVNLAQPRLGSDEYLKRFFDATLIGLDPRTPGTDTTIRPLFSDLDSDGEGHIAKKAERKLWANTFSQSGYRNWRKDGTLEDTSGSNFKLSPQFETRFRKAIDKSFRFEDLLVWLYAFSGFEDTITSWADLQKDFLQKHTYTHTIGSEYLPVFKLDPTVPWPAQLLPSRPSNIEFQDLLLPGTSSARISPEEFGELRDALLVKLKVEYLGFADSDLDSIAVSVVSALQSCRRIFVMGEPGAGKSELAKLVVAAFKEVFDERVLAVSTPVTDTTTADKLIGFSTLDGSWINGVLTSPEAETEKQLLYVRPPKASLPQSARRQINVIVLDEANRRDVEALLAKLQPCLDGESGVPESDEYRVTLDNSGERYVSPNTFVVMTGNSPREDTGRLVQPRPFKRRHNLIVMPNVFEQALNSKVDDFAKTLVALWNHIGPSFQISDKDKAIFASNLQADIPRIDALRIVLSALHEFSIGITYGLAKKVLRTAGAQFALTTDFARALDFGLADSVFPLLSTDTVMGGRGLKERLGDIGAPTSAAFPQFFSRVQTILRPVDNYNRVRPFI